MIRIQKHWQLFKMKGGVPDLWIYAGGKGNVEIGDSHILTSRFIFVFIGNIFFFLALFY
jgi:hypothetical protein